MKIFKFCSKGALELLCIAYKQLKFYLSKPRGTFDLKYFSKLAFAPEVFEEPILFTFGVVVASIVIKVTNKIEKYCLDMENFWSPGKA